MRRTILLSVCVVVALVAGVLLELHPRESAALAACEELVSRGPTCVEEFSSREDCIDFRALLVGDGGPCPTGPPWGREVAAESCDRSLCKRRDEVSYTPAELEQLPVCWDRVRRSRLPWASVHHVQR